MGSFDRSKKKIQLWKKALLQFSLCFVMGFFTGFAPSNTASFAFSGQLLHYYSPTANLGISPYTSTDSSENTEDTAILNRSLMMSEYSSESSSIPETEQNPNTTPAPRLLITVTTTRSEDPWKETLLRRMGQTLRLVQPPLLWIVVEARAEAAKTAETLRKTGIMYRLLTFPENFTDPRAEADHQRNAALNHVEHHRLAGIVHFAGLSNVYDLQFFEEIRGIEAFGTWPVATVSASRKRVLVDGPVCRSSEVVGWRKDDMSNAADKRTYSRELAEIHMSGFAFNSSILWDPERWGRSSSMPDTSQDSIKFVREVSIEDMAKLRGIPAKCSRIMLWNLHVPRNLAFYRTLTRTRQ